MRKNFLAHDPSLISEDLPEGEMSSIFDDHKRPRIRVQMRRTGGGGGVAGSQPMSTGHHVTWSPNKLWRCPSIFNLWDLHISKPIPSEFSHESVKFSSFFNIVMYDP
jgi:hypothetical protein